jgi:hypothetical protein
MHNEPTERTRGGRRRRLALAIAVVTSALAITACGSSSKPKSTVSSSYSRNVKYADCMRSHGVPNFPDPLDGGFPLRTSGINMGSPAFVSAQKACARLQPGGSAPPQITGQQLYEMAAKARCIRKHGFPNFPDPSLSGSAMNPPNWNNEAPAAIEARKACANVGIAIPGWGVAWFGST